MAQISLLSGITSQANADFRTSLPINLVPVPKDTGVSKGYLRFAPGLSQFGTGPGIDRGAINWNDVCYRVMGTSLVSVAADGVVTTIGTITGSGPVVMDYGPVYLSIVGDGKAWLYDGATLTQITDGDLGTVFDVQWIDGYYLYTDGSFLIVSELTNAFSIDPLKYGSSEVDPDRIVGVLKYRNEMYALNRYTIEVFDNTGGTGWPFTRVASAMISKGLVGTKGKALFGDSFAWVGSGRNEPCSVYVATNGGALKIATREVEERLAAYSEAQLATVSIESRSDRIHQHLLIHLPNETLVYDLAASIVAGEPIWFHLSTGASGVNAYRARNFVWVYGKWVCGDTADGRIGRVDEGVVSQYGDLTGWQFDTMWLYNESHGAIVWALELIGTTGRAPGLEDPSVFHSYTLDGVTWSQERMARMGSAGDTGQRVQWRRCGKMSRMRGERFRGANKTPVSWMRLEATLEALSA